MQIYFCSNNSLAGRGLITESHVGQEFQLKIAPTEPGWYLLLSEAADETCYFLATLKQEVPGETWLLWSANQTEEKYLVNLPVPSSNEDSLVFDTVGKEKAFLIKVSQSFAEMLQHRKFLSECSASEILDWILSMDASVASATCVIAPKQRGGE